MKHYRPLLLSDLDLRVMGLVVRGFRLNSQIPENLPATHTHDYEQLIVCLQSRCQIDIRGRRQSGQPGAVFLIPAGTPHMFVNSVKAPSLCLVLDLDLPENLRPSTTRSDLTAPNLSEVKARVAAMFRNLHIESPALRFRLAGAICDILDPVLKALGCIASPTGSRHAAGPKPISKMIDRLLERPGGERMEIAEIAQRLGYQQDNLNRRLKSESGLTVGQYRSQKILKRAQHYLRAGHSVQETAQLTGFPDKNYFSRWFRLQAGITARAWCQENVEPPKGTAGYEHDLFDHDQR